MMLHQYLDLQEDHQKGLLLEKEREDLTLLSREADL